jgi:hypothetical protein
VVPLELVLAQTGEVAVCISRLSGYPSGFEFDLVTMAAPGARAELDPMLFGPHQHHMLRSTGPGELSPELLRIGVQFADGSKATNVGGFHHDSDLPKGPVMHPGGGGGGGGDWRQSEWVWPLPPPGPLSFVCEWPAAGIELSRTEIDAQLILDAAARARVIFPDAQGKSHAPGGSTSTKVIQLRSRPEPHPPEPHVG